MRSVNKLPDQTDVSRVYQEENRRIEGNWLRRQSARSALNVGISGGRSSKTRIVIRTANTPSENALNRSGVALWSTVKSFLVRQCSANSARISNAFVTFSFDAELIDGLEERMTAVPPESGRPRK
jgi:hypothetical protein